MQYVGIIYLIVNNINGKKYVGQTTKSLEKRWYDHCYANKKRKNLLHKAIDKYGKENFTIAQLAPAFFVEMLDDLEKFHILKENSLSPHGYNLETGGNKFKKLNILTKEKIKDSNSGWNCKQPQNKPVTCIEISTGIEKSYKHQGFARSDGFFTSQISRVIKGLDYSHNGFRFKNANDSKYAEFKGKRTPKGILQSLEVGENIRLKNKTGYKVLFLAKDISTSEVIKFSLSELKKSEFYYSNVFKALNKSVPAYKGKVWSREYIHREGA